MHAEILTDQQQRLLPLVKKFSGQFCLVGGTAVALQFGHRRSIDFDLFTSKPFDQLSIRKKILSLTKIQQVIWQETGQYTIIMHNVRFTFFHYPFVLTWNRRFDDWIKMPDLLTLAAMKAYALGKRAKWKDYIDLYFIAKKYNGIQRIITRAERIFGHEFNPKNFRAQLAYFKDIDYTEQVDFLPGFQVSDQTIQRQLRDYSLE